MGEGDDEIEYEGESFNGEIFGEGHITWVSSKRKGEKDKIIGCANNFMSKPIFL